MREVKDNPNVRIIGVETEFGGDGCVEPDKEGVHCWSEPHSECTSYSQGWALRTGGRAYVDAAHFEYAAPEADNPLNATLSVYGGRLAFERISNSLRFNNVDEFGINDYSDHQVATFASHENYLVRGDIWAEICSGKSKKGYDGLWAAFLAARTLIAGAGRPKLDGSYELSQRAEYISGARNLDTIEQRSVINTRDEALCDVRFGKRLHVIVGDGNTLMTAHYLTLLSAHLVLRGLEDGIFDRYAKELKYNLKCAADDFQGISKLNWKFTGTRTKKSPVRLLCDLHGMISDAYLKKLDTPSQLGLKLLGEELSILSRIERWITPQSLNIGMGYHQKQTREDLSELAKYSDWACKRECIATFEVAEERLLSPVEYVSQSMEYASVNQEAVLVPLEEQIGLLSPLVSLTDLQYYSRHAPPNTRAQLRAALVQLRPPESDLQVAWHHVNLPALHSDEIQLSDPYETYLEYKLPNGHQSVLELARKKIPRRVPL